LVAPGLCHHGLTKHNGHDAFFLFPWRVAVGLTPEMLPMIVSVCLSKGARDVEEEGHRQGGLHAIQNFGAMDVLCTDKTGTLTMDHVILELYCDVFKKEKSGGPARCLRHQPLPDRSQRTSSIAPCSNIRKCIGNFRSRNSRKFDEIPFDSPGG